MVQNCLHECSFKQINVQRSSCAGYGFKDGNNKDKFAMIWNIDKRFGMLEELIAIATNEAIRHFLIDAKVGQICMPKDSLSNTENHSEMRTCSSK